MSQINIQYYFSKIAIKSTLVFFIGLMILLLVSTYLQYTEKKSQLILQATYIANAVRNDFINGNKIPVYEQCRSISALENIKKIIIKNENYTFCNESSNNVGKFLISVSVPIKFQPNYSDDNHENNAGFITLGIDGKEMFYYFLSSICGLLIMSISIYLYMKSSYDQLQSDIITPITQLTFAMENNLEDLHYKTQKNINIVELRNMYDTYIKFCETKRIAESLKLSHIKSEAIIGLAKQVAHDIRSPLSVIKIILSNISLNLENEKFELLNLATQRIDKIAEDLLNKEKEAPPTNEILVADIEKIILEKQTILASNNSNIRIELQHSTFETFISKVSKLNIERILSNLLNNSIESIQEIDNGIVQIGLTKNLYGTIIKIRDNGKGINLEDLSKIGTKGFTSGKISGNGLGVYHAKTTLENTGGIFEIESTVGLGTTITITV